MSLMKLLQGARLSSTAEVTLLFLKALKVPVTASTVQNAFDVHPHDISLYAISDSLKRWKVDTICLQLEVNQIHELPVPFLAHLHVDGGSFVVVTEVTEQKVAYLRNDSRKTEKSIAAFARECSRVALLAEAREGAGEKDYTARRRKQRLSDSRIPAILIGFFILIGFSFYVGVQTEGLVAILPATLAIIKLAGCLIAGLLLWYEIDSADPVLRQICSAGKKTDCNAVLGSHAAKVLPEVSWSEVGFIYFSTGCLLLTFSAQAPLEAFGLLAWINLIALPYIVFSVFYQWKVVKQWCPLCLAVQGVLAIEALIFFFGYWSQSIVPTFNLSTIMLALIAFALPSFFWMFVKPLLLKAQQANNERREVAKLKYNPALFNALLPTQKSIQVSPEGLGITLGNPLATNTIIKVCNPFCAPCAKSHPMIEELLEQNNDIKVQIIFTATNHEKDMKAAPVKHLMALSARKDEYSMKQALNDWYQAEKKDYDLFKSKYPIPQDELKGQGTKLEEMRKWCSDTGISFTPTFFINKHQLPSGYTLEDLKHLL